MSIDEILTTIILCSLLFILYKEWLFESNQANAKLRCFVSLSLLFIFNSWCAVIGVLVNEAAYDSLTSLSFSSSWNMFRVTVPWTSTSKLMTKQSFTCVYMQCTLVQQHCYLWVKIIDQKIEFRRSHLLQYRQAADDVRHQAPHTPY